MTEPTARDPARRGLALSRMDRLVLGATVFGTGAGVMIVEMTAVRALEPFFGSTVWIWTNVIAVVLGALAVGAALGGRLADRHPSRCVLLVEVVLGGLLIAGSAFLVRPVSELFIDRSLRLEGITSLLARGSLGATLILFAPAAVLAGLVGPMAIRLWSGRGPGRAAGRVLALSTLGSILGTYLPATILIPQVGSRGSLLVAASVLLLAGAAGLALFRRRGLAAATGLLLAVVLGALVTGVGGAVRTPGVPVEGGSSTVVGGVESGYQYVEVRTDAWPDGRVLDVLTINEGVHAYQSVRQRGSVLTGARYYDDYSLLPILLDRPRGSTLDCCIVGFAGGVIARQWHHFWSGWYDLSVEGAEIDPEVVAMARRHLGLPGPDADWLRVHPMDGRQLLVGLPEGRRYHLLVIDAFANQLVHPFHLATLEFFELCRRRLEPGGILAINVSATNTDSPHLRAIANTLSVAFGSCQELRQAPERNYLLLAREGDSPPEVARLNAIRIRDRFGERADLPEWAVLVENAQRLPPRVRHIATRDDLRVLTDENAPLEWLTGQTLGQLEREIVR